MSWFKCIDKSNLYIEFNFQLNSNKIKLRVIYSQLLKSEMSPCTVTPNANLTLVFGVTLSTT